jgi:hypothetical protein
MLYLLSYASPIASPLRSSGRHTKAAPLVGHEYQDYHSEGRPAMKPRPKPERSIAVRSAKN